MSQRKSFEEAINECLDFSIKTFSDSTALASLKKLQEETSEAIIGIEKGLEVNTREEFADMTSVLFHAAYLKGITVYDLIDELLKKLEKNKKRTWVKNAIGSYSHAPEDWEREEKDKIS